MNAPERKALLSETREFIESEELMRLATAFPGWVPIDPMTGEGPPNWKTAMLVLLGLFPIVMLEMKFLSPILAGAGHPCLTGHVHRQRHQRRADQFSHHAALCELVRLVAFPKRQQERHHHQGRRHSLRPVCSRSDSPVETPPLVTKSFPRGKPSYGQ